MFADVTSAKYASIQQQPLWQVSNHIMQRNNWIQRQTTLKIEPLQIYQLTLA